MTEKGAVTAGMNNVVQRYGQLEFRLQREMAARCGAHCTRCQAPCCKVVFCRESLESPFLAMVRERFSEHVQWDSSNGWLTSKGCSLAAGRPPVCYEFICTAIANAHRFTNHHKALNDLAMLMTTAGKNACGKSHLVELDNLERSNIRRLMVQLSQAENALARLVSFWEGVA